MVSGAAWRSNRSMSMNPLFASHSGGRRRQDNPDDIAVPEEAEDLPLSPDDDFSVIPDEERVIDMPS